MTVFRLSQRYRCDEAALEDLTALKSIQKQRRVKLIHCFLARILCWPSRIPFETVNYIFLIIKIHQYPSLPTYNIFQQRCLCLLSSNVSVESVCKIFLVWDLSQHCLKSHPPPPPCGSSNTGTQSEPNTLTLEFRDYLQGREMTSGCIV